MSYYKMIDVSDKLTNKRIAIASGKIYVGEPVFNLIRNNQMIKGDPLRLAEIAAIMGAKQTSNLIPLCHPIGLDKVEFINELVESDFAVQVYCIATTSAKTGVEMEALAGVTTGLLTIYDLSKISEPSLTISDIRLLVKIGGKSGTWFNPQITGLPSWIDQYIPKPINLSAINFATITLSDRAVTGVYADKSGELLQQLLSECGATSLGYYLLSDDAQALKYKISELINNPMSTSNPMSAMLNLIVTTGGTGIGERDIVPEAILALGGREIPGIGELLRIYGSKFTSFSWCSRSLACVVDNILIIALPGSSNAVREGVECLVQILPHLIKMVQGGNHD